MCSKNPRCTYVARQPRRARRARALKVAVPEIQAARQFFEMVSEVEVFTGWYDSQFWKLKSFGKIGNWDNIMGVSTV